ncbi:MAG TPA: ThiF family adenylyltransferase [Gammaproteobacteria bacterium]|nr:ThiF family adenylyltransferase [Gammaproteobacteria bacterium]
MSRTPINRSPDLNRLEEDGYEIEILEGYLVLHHIPYVDAKGKIRFGTLVSTLKLAADKALPPDTHVCMFAGEHPCDHNGKKLHHLDHGAGDQKISDDITINWSFSCKPKPADKYANYYDKMTTYVAMISGHAEQLDPSVTARTFQVIESSKDNSPFNYIDNASGRAGITAHAKKLELAKIAIVGLGGTGAYVLDLTVKTPVLEIHIYDGDWFVQHNAFRAPGAASADELRARLRKVDYYQAKYAPMRRGIVPHPVYVDESNVEELRGFDFVFLCMDGRPGKEAVIRKLEEFGVPFIDTGMGIENSDDGLRGVLRVTTSTPKRRDHVWKKHRIPLASGEADNIYASNIQVADLNAFCAALAVIRWKKYFGFYADLEGEHFTTYTIDGNAITNEDEE